MFIASRGGTGVTALVGEGGGGGISGAGGVGFGISGCGGVGGGISGWAGAGGDTGCGAGAGMSGVDGTAAVADASALTPAVEPEAPPDTPSLPGACGISVICRTGGGGGCGASRRPNTNAPMTMRWAAMETTIHRRSKVPSAALLVSIWRKPSGTGARASGTTTRSRSWSGRSEWRGVGPIPLSW